MATRDKEQRNKPIARDPVMAERDPAILFLSHPFHSMADTTLAQMHI